MARLSQPLNPDAVQAADDEFYANHPEFVKDGQRIPLSATDPSQAALRAEWVALYEKHNGAVEPDPSAPKKPDDPVEPCTCKEACKYWQEDHVVDFNGQDTTFVSSTQIAAAAAAFRLTAGLASGRLKITSIFNWGTVAADVTDAEKTATIAQFKAQVATWSGHFSLRVVDPICGEKTLPIAYDLLWSPDDTADAAPFHVNLYKTFPRAGVTGSDVDIGYDSDVTPDGGWVLAHEYGHTVCLPDEYFYAGVTAATVVYKKADGSTESIALEPTTPSIMQIHADRTYFKRFFYFIEVKAQELLRAKSGRDVVCSIV